MDTKEKQNVAVPKSLYNKVRAFCLKNRLVLCRTVEKWIEEGLEKDEKQSRD